MASAAADRVTDYAKEKGRQIQEMLDQPERTVFNWTWWAEQVGAAADTMMTPVAYLSATAQKAGDAAAMAYKLWSHREEIMKLPEMIAGGDVKGVQKFVDTTLMDIDGELASEIRNSQDFHAVLSLIDDPESAVTYMTYVSLTLEAIPPNFYAYIGGKAGMFIVCEVVLLLVAALLSAGAGVAARVAALTARIAASGVKAATASKKIQNALRAIKAFETVIKRFVEVAGDLRALGHKLTAARQRGVRLQAPTKTTAVARRETVKRDRKCRICGSTRHKTPAHVKRGCVVYR
jgi:hypothetical protein